MPHLQRNARIGELCAGNGALCHHIANAGWDVTWASDIEPQHPNVVQLDLFGISDAAGAFDIIVTNPSWPEKGKKGDPTVSIANHLISIAPTWLLLPSDFMHNVYAADLMRQCSRIVSVGRVQWIPGSEHTGVDNCAWYEFMPFANGGVLSFVPRQPKQRRAA